MGSIDLHAHYLTTEYLEALTRHDMLGKDGFPLPSWNADDHLRFMDEASIDEALLSVSSPHPWFGDASEAADVARALNETAAKTKADHPQRFLFAASLPLPDVSRSVEEIRFAYETLGADAVKIPSNAAGVYPGDPRLDDVLDELDAHDAVVIIHPCASAGCAPECFSGRMPPLMEFLADTTRCVTELLVSGALERHSHLRVVVPHCGSFLPSIASRIEGMTHVLADQGRLAAPVSAEALGRLWFDVAGDAMPRGLAMLRTLASDDHIVYGSDYPFAPSPVAIQKRNALEEGLAPDLWDAVSHANAEVLLRPPPGR